MNSNLQNETPKARVNITLDLETYGASEKTELPLKLLVMGRFSEEGDSADIASREKINMTADTIDQVMQSLSPHLSLTVPNHLNKNSETLSIHMTLQNLSHFHPDQLVHRIPELKRFLAMRNLLKDLKANLIDNPVLKTELEKRLQDRKQMHDQRTPFKPKQKQD